MKLQKRLADDDFVTVVEWMPVARQKASSTVDKRSIRAAQVFEDILPILADDAGMAARNLGFRVILIKVNIRKDTPVRIPAPDIGLRFGQQELLANRSTPLDDQFGAWHRGRRGGCRRWR